jgi:hypothetical protein
LYTHFAELLSLTKHDGLVPDGELYHHGLSFQRIQSVLRTASAPLPSGFHLALIDCLELSEWNKEDEPPFMERLLRTKETFAHGSVPNVIVIKQHLVRDADEARGYFERCIKKGYEGIMLRDPHGRYKHGRATINQGIIYKMKEWVTIDVVIIGFEQRRAMKDEVRFGQRERDILGKLEHTCRKDDFVLIEEIGSVNVRLPDGAETGVNFARGFLHRGLFNWAACDKWIGKHVEIRYMRVGAKNRPRFGMITRLRPELDD